MQLTGTGFLVRFPDGLSGTVAHRPAPTMATYLLEGWINRIMTASAARVLNIETRGIRPIAWMAFYLGDYTASGGKKEIEERHCGCFAVDALCKAPNPPQTGVVHASGSPGL